MHPVKSHAADQAKTVEAYKKAVASCFTFLKQTRSLDDLFAKSSCLTGVEGYLAPVCELHATDRRLITKLAQWRRTHATAFPTQFPVTLEGTASWLRSKLLDVEDRLLFLILDRLGEAIGHLGLANTINDARAVEIDNVVRGVAGVHPGIMSAAMRTLLEWTEQSLAPQCIFLRVLDDNVRAIDFYRRLHFAVSERIPLRRHQENDCVTYVPLPADAPQKPDKHFVRMVYEPPATAAPSQLILTAGPFITAREVSYTLDAVRHGWNRRWNHYINRFEEAFARYIGVRHALTTSSCTGALHLALASLGIGPGDEVIVPEVTWVATANAVVYVGATPVFADIEPESWCLDPASFEACITKRTKAVIPVHLYGHPARMDRIMEIARAHGLHVVEDAAPAIGAEFRGRRVGAFGHFAAFSFQGAKLLVTGEGGMLVTNDSALFEKAHTISDQGRDPQKTFWISQHGLKYKMSNVQAALGLGQLEHLDEMIEKKRLVFSWYFENLMGVPGAQLRDELPWARSIHWMPCLLLEPNGRLSRDQLRAALHQRNIDSRPVFPAISQYPVWKHHLEPKPVARRIAEWGINLPGGVCLKRTHVKYICDSIKEILKHAAG